MAIERIEHALELGRVEARALVDDPDDRLLPSRSDPNVHGCRGRRELEGVLDEIGDRPLHLAPIDLDDRRLAGHVHLLPPVDRVNRLPNEIHQIPCLSLRRSRACLQPGQIEQIADQAGEPARLELDRLEQVLAVGAAQAQFRSQKRADRRPDAGQRRAQIVRHGPQQRRLDQVAAPEHLCLHRLALQLFPLGRDSEERRESREEPVADLDARIPVGGRVDRPDVPSYDLQRIRNARTVIPPGWAELDNRRLDSEHFGRVIGDLTDLLLELPAGQQLDRQIGEERRLTFALLRRGRPTARAGRELADDHGGRQVYGEREPVFAVGERERWRGGRKNQLKASMLATETARAKRRPKTTATGRTAKM